MKENLLEYVLDVDKYFLLWLDAVQRKDPRRYAKIINNGEKELIYPDDLDYRYIPEVIPLSYSVSISECNQGLIGALFDENEKISVIEASFPMSCKISNNKFHTENDIPSLRINRIKLLVSNRDATDLINDIKILPTSAFFWYNDDGPAEILLENIEIFHYENILHRHLKKRKTRPVLTCGYASFKWNTENEDKPLYSRTGGPFSVTIKNISTSGNMGVLEDMSFDDISYHWSITGNASRTLTGAIRKQPRKKQLRKNQIEEILSRTKINVDLLSTKPNIFESLEDEFIFTAELSKY